MPFDGAQLNEAAAHLLRAKEYILDHGWCWGASRGDNGTVCVVVALGDTAQDRLFAAVPYFTRAVGVEDKTGNIAAWNDTPGRTVHEVLVAFDRAIALAMSDG
jgi:hypothetical protein